MGTIRGVSSMKAQLTITIEDNGNMSMALENPSGIGVWEIIGLLEKVKSEFLLTTPRPEYDKDTE